MVHADLDANGFAVRKNNRMFVGISGRKCSA